MSFCDSSACSSFLFRGEGAVIFRPTRPIMFWHGDGRVARVFELNEIKKMTMMLPSLFAKASSTRPSSHREILHSASTGRLIHLAVQCGQRRLELQPPTAGRPLPATAAACCFPHPPQPLSAMDAARGWLQPIHHLDQKLQLPCIHPRHDCSVSHGAAPPG